jgi:hypothetical protein
MISDRSKPKCTKHETEQSGTKNSAELVRRNVQWARHRRCGYPDSQKVESIEQRHQTAKRDDPDLQSPERPLVEKLADVNASRC